jgi:hypothetical protein
MKLGALTLGAYRLMIIISFWSISPFISMVCPSNMIKTQIFQVLCDTKGLVIKRKLGKLKNIIMEHNFHSE